MQWRDNLLVHRRVNQAGDNGSVPAVQFIKAHQARRRREGLDR